jgi:hypothetical protein
MIAPNSGTGNSAVSPQGISTLAAPVICGTVNGAVNANVQATVSNVALTSNVATITTSANNGFLSGQFLECVSLSVATALNSVAGQVPFGPITVTSATVFTFPFTNANIASAANTGTAMVCQTLVTAGPAGCIVTGINAVTNDSSTNNVQLYLTNAAYPPGNNYTAVVTAAGTTTLTSTSYQANIFTGSTTQTVVLPAVSTLAVGAMFQVVNFSTGVVTVQSSGANAILAQAANTVANYTYNGTTGTGIASWSVYYAPVAIYPLVTTAVVTNSGTSGSVVAVNLLTATQVPAVKVDAYGNPCVELPPGWSILVNTLAIVTAAKTLTITPIAAEAF